MSGRKREFNDETLSIADLESRGSIISDRYFTDHFAETKQNNKLGPFPSFKTRPLRKSIETELVVQVADAKPMEAVKMEAKQLGLKSSKSKKAEEEALLHVSETKAKKPKKSDFDPRYIIKDPQAEQEYEISGVDIRYAEMKAEENLALSERHEFIELSASPDEFSHFGGAYVQLFTFAKHIIVLLGILTLVLGIYSLYLNLTTVFCVDVNYSIPDSYFTSSIYVSNTSSSSNVSHSNDAFSPWGVLSVGTTLGLNPVSCYRSWATDLSAMSRFPNTLASSIPLNNLGKLTAGETIAYTTMLIIFVIGLCISRAYFLRKASQDKKTAIPCDFTVKVEGLPIDTTADDIASFFRDQEVDVVDVVPAYSFGDYSEEVKEYTFLKEWVTKRGRRFGDLDKRLDDAEQKAKLLDKEFTGVAFVTFRTRAEHKRIIHNYSRLLSCCLRNEAERYKGTYSVPRITRVPYVQDILWENLGFKRSLRVGRRAIGILIVLGIILVIQILNITAICVVATYKASSTTLQYFSFGLSTFVMAGNLLIEWVIGKSVNWEKYHSRIERAVAQIERTYLCQILNSSLIATAFIIFLGFPRAYSGNLLDLLIVNGASGLGASTSMILQEISFNVMTMFFLSVLVAGFRAYNCKQIYRKASVETMINQGAKVGYSQQEVNKIFRYPEFELEKAYSTVLTVLIFALTTSVWTPINLVGGFIYLIILYWMFKKQLISQCSRPTYAGSEYGLAVFETMKSGVVICFVVVAFAGAYKFLYANSAVSSSAGLKTLGGIHNIVTMLYTLFGILFSVLFYFIPTDWLSKICILGSQAVERQKKAQNSRIKYEQFFQDDSNTVKDSDPLRDVFA